MSEVAPRGKLELCRASISAPGAEDGKAMGSVWPLAHKGAESNGFRSNTRKDVKRVSGGNVREVRDYSNAVPSIGGFVGRGVSGWGGMRKSRGRVRT
jgi:hypothetical protein